MKTAKKVGLLVLIIFAVIQFTQPKRNEAPQLISENDISKTVNIPVELHQMLVNKCYDCHSNTTQYPWYANIQPLGWWLAAHVHEGKEHLNFSEFKTYPKKRADHKLEEIGEVTEDKSMPLKAYTLIHQGSELTEEEQKAIMTWLSSLGIKPH